ncbi:hypothetical protein EHS25_005649 [Saitozyma podzolica]|uniref:Uncharacterized protein n=1 Tax=Saitozyma podzolica TaxID=1890683 RepID=A0A427XVS7_9TREE|nr:hypothetical protein EHS25_005649 [Saitozyma podzolica]
MATLQQRPCPISLVLGPSVSALPTYGRLVVGEPVEDESPPETVFGAIGVAAMDDAAVEVEHVTRLKVAMPEVGSSGSLSSLTLFREDDGGVLMTEDLVVV